MSLIASDVLLTRNADETKNDSPGYWNHAAIYIGKGLIIEAQAKPDSVITSQLEEFWNRYPEIVVLRWITCDTKRDIPITAACDLLGVSYRKVASAFKFMRNKERGENCVSVVRKAYTKALGYDPKWHIPDDIIRDNVVFMVEGYKS